MRLDLNKTPLDPYDPQRRDCTPRSGARHPASHLFEPELQEQTMIRCPIRPGVLLLPALGAVCVLAACGGGSGGELEPTLAPPAPFVAMGTPAAATASEYDKHMAVATTAWANYNDIIYPKFCYAPGTGTDAALQDQTTVPPTQLFDELYYVGQIRWGTYALKTDDGGFLQFDTMSSAADANNVILPGLKSLGFDPSRMRSILITHRHFDHFGGGPTLLSAVSTSLPVWASSADQPGIPYGVTNTIDSTNKNVQQVTVGGKQIMALSTPGHTVGTMSFILPVHYKGVEHKVVYWGGSAFPTTVDLASQYLDSTERMVAAIRATGADASINSHTFFDRTQDRINAIQAAKGISTSNPMIQGTEKVALSYTVLRACSAALLSKLDATAVHPVWMPTRTEFYGAQALPYSSTVLVGARVSNFFNVISGAQVTFTAANGSSCVATTDKDGLASCRIDNAPGTAAITAAFAGSSDASAVQMPSSATRTPG
jgi:glyoxylase-like metal-dependent hydrolase (beta-lactamase superfamily II)